MILKQYRTCRIAGCIWLTMLAGNANAQFYESGTEPASVRWQQINTEHFRIIFPKGAEKDGQKVASTMEFIRRADGKTLNHYPAQKTPVVLHGYTAHSNGLVVWAPKRSEWYIRPPQDNYAHNWLEQLALHEYRHVVQTSMLNRGFTKIMGYAAGQQAVGAVAGLVPRWFLEGDAVATETALSSSGRGRSPAFEMPLRTLALSGKQHSYGKALFGSYRDHVPNHYELGYQLVAWTRNRYGVRPFEAGMDMIGRRPYLFFMYPFKYSLKKTTGMYTGQLYRHVFKELTEQWRYQEMQTGYRATPAINRRTDSLYSNYRSPQYLNDSTLIALKTGMAQIPQFVKINSDGREQVVAMPGMLNSDRISYASGWLAWTEVIEDARWENRSYSVIKLLNMATGKRRTLRKYGWDYSPAIAPDGKMIAAVEVSLDGQSKIVLLDVQTGNVTNMLQVADGFLQMPAWARDGKSIIAIVNNRDGKSIVRIDIATGQQTLVLPPAYDDISNPADGGSCILFTGHYNGINNIYAIDGSGEIKQVTAARFGAFDAHSSTCGNRLTYAEYSAHGYNIVDTHIDTEQWIPAQQLNDYSLKLHETLARQEGFNMQDSTIAITQHPVKPYRKWAHLLNVHSWAPMYYEVDVDNAASTELYPGVVLFSQDLLDNLVASAGYSWQGDHVFHAAFTYKGLYPVMDFRIEHGGMPAVIGLPSNTRQASFLPQQRNTAISFRTYIPLAFTRSRWITGALPQIQLSYRNSSLYSDVTDSYHSGLVEASYGFQAYRYLRTSVRDLFPKFGLVLQGNWKHTPWNTTQLGHIYYLFGRIYLPGIARHHSLQLTGAWQKQQTRTYLFGSSLRFPRGYISGRTEKLSIATVDYALPLCYPDWDLNILAYIRRLRTNLFCDVASNSYRAGAEWRTDRLLSTGIDLLADTHLLQISFPVSIGVRITYLPDTSDLQPSLLFSIAFN